MTKEEYGELLKYLGIFRYAIHRFRNQQNDFEIKDDILQAICLLLTEMPLLEEYIR